ncbi:MAG: hypothetical protein IRY94_15425 [Rhodospirillaceae bacterium]|nr:hypothetical protein [Rhodospirillaceae bacterium]
MPANVSARTLKTMRRERRQAPPVETLLTRWRRESAEERSVREQAEELYRRLQPDVTWAACVQAVKTNWVSSLLAKHETRRRERTGAAEEKARTKA